MDSHDGRKYYITAFKSGTNRQVCLILILARHYCFNKTWELFKLVLPLSTTEEDNLMVGALKNHHRFQEHVAMLAPSKKNTNHRRVSSALNLTKKWPVSAVSSAPRSTLTVPLATGSWWPSKTSKNWPESPLTTTWATHRCRKWSNSPPFRKRHEQSAKRPSKAPVAHRRTIQTTRISMWTR